MAAKGPPLLRSAVQADSANETLARLARERELLDEACEDVRAGRFIADEDVDAWLSSLARDESPTMPTGSPESRLD